LIGLHMPGMDGDEVADRLRRVCDPVPVLVAVTAMSNEQSCARTAAAGFDLHLVKPVDPHKMMCILDTLWHAWHNGRFGNGQKAEAVAQAAECE
jgi:two-component system OmpR family response regulator